MILSVIVIACEVEPYIGKCIRSILEQDFPDFELIVGVETSADRTMEEVRKAVGSDARCKVTEMPKSGSASRIRNYGIRHAQGEYLMFVDGDDWIVPGALARIAAEAERRHTPDILALGAKLFHENEQGELSEDQEPIFDGPPADAVMDGIKRMYTGYFRSQFFMATWLRVYRKQFLTGHGLYQPEGRRHQDVDWTPRVLFFAKSVAIVPFAYYCYRKRPGSVTTKIIEKSIYDEAENTRDLLAFRAKNETDIPPYFQYVFSEFLTSFVWVFFNRRKFSMEARARAFSICFASPENRRNYTDAVQYAGLAKRLMKPIVWIGLRSFRLADFVYVWIYSPLIFRLWNAVKSRGK